VISKTSENKKKRKRLECEDCANLIIFIGELNYNVLCVHYTHNIGKIASD
jgi:hypothetical protein